MTVTRLRLAALLHRQKFWGEHPFCPSCLRKDGTFAGYSCRGSLNSALP